MIVALIRTGLIELKRDRVALGLTFVLPILFFSIFAIVFGQTGSDGASRVNVIVVDEDGSDASRRLIDALAAEPAIRLRTRTDADGNEQPWTQDEARAGVEDGDVPVAIILPEGFGSTVGRFFGDVAPIDLLIDTADPIAGRLVGGLLQKTAFTALPDLMVDQGLSAFEEHGGPMTPAQRLAAGALKRFLTTGGGPIGEGNDSGSASDDGFEFGGPITVNTIDVHQSDERKKNPAVSYYAAGTGVMFLLFSAAGAGGSLLDEQDNGTLERVLTSRISMTGLLLSKWILIAGIGAIQVTLMFVWGQLLFGLPLTAHIPGFVAMTIATALSASAFGLVLAAACRSRAQLSGASTIIILIMSAIGGSMFPRFMMPEVMQKAGLLTFNGWSLDGYRKVFWNDASLVELWPQLSVLTILTIVLFLVARLLAGKWEAA